MAGETSKEAGEKLSDSKLLTLSQIESLSATLFALLLAISTWTPDKSEEWAQ